LNRQLEIIARRRNGQEFPVELTVKPIKAGETWTFSAFVRDITERKLAEGKLRDSELRLHMMTETIPQMLWSVTPEGAFDYCN
jgi:PAS domain-containing protein